MLNAEDVNRYIYYTGLEAGGEESCGCGGGCGCQTGDAIGDKDSNGGKTCGCGGDCDCQD